MIDKDINIKVNLNKMIHEINNANTKHQIQLSEDQQKKIKAISKSIDNGQNNDEFLTKHCAFIKTILNDRNESKTSVNHLQKVGFFREKNKVNKCSPDLKQYIRQKKQKQNCTLQTPTYKGGFAFEDFDSQYLFRIHNPDVAGEQYLYFNESIIKEFKSLGYLEEKFQQLVKSDTLRIIGEKGEGIKPVGIKHQIKCTLSSGNKSLTSFITYELKISGCPERLAVINMEGSSKLPNILVVTHYLKNGIHDTRHNGSIVTCDLPLNCSLISESITASNRL